MFECNKNMHFTKFYCCQNWTLSRKSVDQLLASGSGFNPNTTVSVRAVTHSRGKNMWSSSKFANSIPVYNLEGSLYVIIIMAVANK